MIDDNISMEEDTELRELVVQTLENNGVLAKVRAELRASVFLTLEEQESVLNPEPFLNKSVKQYLANPEGKILFSLVREFLEYFGLDYTISVYDPETYCGKEYNYVDRKKLCEEFGIDSKEPLLGELLKNVINGALNNSQKVLNKSKSNCDDSRNTTQSSEKLGNATFDISVPTVLQQDSNYVCDDTSEKLESVTLSNLDVPINVTITKKQNEHLSNNKNTNYSPSSKKFNVLSDTVDSNLQSPTGNSNFIKENTVDQIDNISDEKNLNTNNNPVTKLETNLNKETFQNKKTLIDSHPANNMKNKQIDPLSKSGKTVYFDQIIVDGTKEKLSDTKEENISQIEMPSLLTANNSLFGDLPPLNGKKANMNDLKELMDIAQGVSKYDEDITSSSYESAGEQSPDKSQFVSKSPETYINKEMQNVQSENDSEEIDEEIPSNTSYHEDLSEKNDNLIIAATKDAK